MAENDKKRLPGGQPANQSAVRHGLRQTVSKLPKSCQYISQSCYGLRRNLEDWCLEQGSQVGLWQSCCIQSAIRYEQVSQLAARWLRESDATLTHAERLAYSKQIAEASEKRDRCLLRLGLDREHHVLAGWASRDPLARLLAGHPEPDADDADQPEPHTEPTQPPVLGVEQPEAMPTPLSPPNVEDGDGGTLTEEQR